MAYFLLQKKPDGASSWDDSEGRTYSFAMRLPNAKALSKNDRVLFYRPTKSGTPEDGCIYAVARVGTVVVGNRGAVDADLIEFVWFQKPIPLTAVGDPRANPQHSFQPVPRSFFEAVLSAAGIEGTPS
ncbi:MAG: hypothetical protein AB7T37_11065 [Dehalococcoidia bacterium]